MTSISAQEIYFFKNGIKLDRKYSSKPIKGKNHSSKHSLSLSQETFLECSAPKGENKSEINNSSNPRGPTLITKH